MASERTIEIVKATVPVLEVKGEEITTVFYKNMLEGHPELLNIFNHANQQKGRQQRALAQTVYAAAKYIDQLHVLLPAVRQIAHKHRSLMIKPEHYPIVGKYLLEAIKEVLGSAATDDIINAWAEAYGEIADIFIAAEKELYDKTGSWNGFRPFSIVAKVKESDEVVSFYLKPEDRNGLPLFEPGQYVTVRFAIPGDPYVVNRQYSISNAPGQDQLRISVKREAIPGLPEGKVSNYLHDHFSIGDTIDVTAPAGEFTVKTEEETPVHFIAGGIGITPFMSMIHETAMKNPERTITVTHAVRNVRVQAFKKELALLQEQMPNMQISHFYGELDNQQELKANEYEGRVDENYLESLAGGEEALYAVCGPVAFMQEIISFLKKAGINDDQIKYEFFGPSLAFKEEAAV